MDDVTAGTNVEAWHPVMAVAPSVPRDRDEASLRRARDEALRRVRRIKRTAAATGAATMAAVALNAGLAPMIANAVGSIHLPSTRSSDDSTHISRVQIATRTPGPTPPPPAPRAVVSAPSQVRHLPPPPRVGYTTLPPAAQPQQQLLQQQPDPPPQTSPS